MTHKQKNMYPPMFLFLGILLFFGCKEVSKQKLYTKKGDLDDVKLILKVLDSNCISVESVLDLWVEDLHHMPPNGKAINGKEELRNYLEIERKHGYANMKHEIGELYSYLEIVLMSGQVNGIYYPKDSSSPIPFKTKNLFVFRRTTNNSLKIWKVIWNMTPN